MSFESALSGLKGAASLLNTIGNNIANADTTAFKQSRVEFSDLIANQEGSGVQLAGVKQQFVQGNVTFTDNPLDLAISGDGFFRVSKDGDIQFSRAGAFGLDKDGYIVNNNSQRLTGFVAASDGTLTGVLGDLQISNSDIDPKSTSTMGVTVNLSSTAKMPSTDWVGTATFGGTTPSSSTYNNTNLTTVYDSLGSSHTVSAFFVKAGPSNSWDVRFQVDGVDVSSTAVSGLTTATSLTTSGQAATVSAGELTINGTAVTPVAGDDTVSTSDNAASGLALATRINATTLSPTVTAEAMPTRVNLGTFTTGTINSGELVINGSNIVTTVATKGALLTAVNNLTSTTGVTASENSTGQVVLTAADGRNIQLLTDGTATNATFSSFGLTGGSSVDRVQRAQVMLKSASNITIAGTTPTDANLTAGTISSQIAEPFRLVFNSDGTLNTASSDTTSITWSPLDTTGVSSGATSPQTITVDLTSSKRLGGDFSIQDITQNGYASGRLSNIDIGTDGIILGRYTNGQSNTLGQVILSNFRNPQGLKAVGDSNFVETVASGLSIIGTPNTGSFGEITSGALEDSNVALTDALVELIEAQRSYQANAQTIRTEDAVTQTIINLR